MPAADIDPGLLQCYRFPNSTRSLIEQACEGIIPIELKTMALQRHHILPPAEVRHLVSRWLREDCPNFDYAGFVAGEREEQAVILCKSDYAILAGQPFVDSVFTELGCVVRWDYKDGDVLEKKLGQCTVATVKGKARHLLLGERVALNCLSRASGIATLARRFKCIQNEVSKNGITVEICGTRKTTPGFRLVEKYSLLIGGIAMHRYDLSSMIMLKDNHILAVGSISKAVVAARSVGGFSAKIEVECRSFAEADEAVLAGADVVMLDNFEPKILHETAASLKSKHANIVIEASGGVTEENVREYIGPHIDVISSGQTTQGYSIIDFSMKLIREGHDPTNPEVKSL